MLGDVINAGCALRTCFLVCIQWLFIGWSGNWLPLFSLQTKARCYNTPSYQQASRHFCLYRSRIWQWVGWSTRCVPRQWHASTELRILTQDMARTSKEGLFWCVLKVRNLAHFVELVWVSVIPWPFQVYTRYIPRDLNLELEVRTIYRTIQYEDIIWCPCKGHVSGFAPKIFQGPEIPIDFTQSQTLGPTCPVSSSSCWCFVTFVASFQRSVTWKLPRLMLAAEVKVTLN